VAAPARPRPPRRRPNPESRLCSRSYADGSAATSRLVGDAAAAEATVAARVLREVLLVVILGVVERPRVANLGRDPSAPGRRQPLLIRREARERRVALLVVVRVDARAVLRADVRALPHALRRIVRLPEVLQQRLVRDPLGLVDDEHHLGVARPPAAYFLV